MSVFYQGFSSPNFITNGTFITTGVQTVERDLLNEIFTIPGERVKHPTYGTRIPLCIFEQNDEITRGIIEEDLRRVVDKDPRVQLIDLKLLTLAENNAIVVFVDLLYLELNGLIQTMAVTIKMAG